MVHLLAAAALAFVASQAGAQLSAASADGRYVAAASDLTLILRDAEGRTLKTFPAPAPISFLLDAARRKSFVVAFDGALELWEVSYDPKAEPIAEGVVHDFRLREGTFVEGFLNPRRTKLDQPLEDVVFVAEGSLVVGRQRDTRNCVVLQLDVRRAIAWRDC